MRRLVWFAIGICAGCAMGVYAFGGEMFLWISLAVAMAVVSVLYFCKKKLGLILLGLALGLLYTSVYYGLYLSGTGKYDGQAFETVITATDYSQQTDYGIQTEGKISLDGKTYCVRIYINEQLQVEPGDELKGNFLLRLTAPGGSKELSYYQGEGVWFIAYARGEITVAEGKGEDIRYLPQRLCRAVLGRLESLFPEDTVAFAKALLLGDTEELSYEQDTALKISGIRHIVAVSGLHVSILFALIYTMAGKRRYLTAFLGIPMLLLFAFVVGLTPSIMRACVMQSLMMLALLFHREYDPPSALAFAVLVILGINPFAIASVSFQLSCGCIVGIFLFSGRFQRRFRAFTKGFTLWAKLRGLVVGSLSVTVGTMIVTVPLCAYYFETVSLIGLITNMLTLPVVSVIFYGILSALGVSILFVPLGSFVAVVISILMRYVLHVAQFLSKLPFAAVYTASPYILIWLVLCYVLFGIFWLCGKKHMGKTVVAMVCLLVMAMLFSWIEPRLDNYRLTVLDVGQGQSILIQSKGETYLVDCGGSSDTSTADTTAVQLLSQGVRKIDGVILTHYDADHVGGLAYLLQRMDADKIYLPVQDVPLPFSLPEGQEVIYLSEIEIIQVGVGQLTLIPGDSDAESNDCSTCVLFQAKECDILITGDRSTSGEKRLMEQYKLPELEVLIAGHHGSNSSTGFSLLTQTKPDTVIISVAENNSYGHPDVRLLERLKLFGCRILRTDKHGNIIIRG